MQIRKNNAISKSSKKSIGKLLAVLGVPPTTLRKHMNVDLKLFPYRPMFVQELSDDDLNRHMTHVKECFKNLE